MDWIKRNKLAAVLILILAIFLVRNYLPIFGPTQLVFREKVGVQPQVEAPMAELGAPDLYTGRSIVPPQTEAPPVEQEERLVVEESSMSLVVSQVQEAADKVVDKAKEAGGFMVSTSLTHPEEAPFATVIVRVPSDKFREVLDYFRDLAVKVSSERILGTDVTAEYVDIEARLETLEKTKAKFEEIMEKATAVQDILNVQRELIRTQDQIDALKGQQKYLEQTAKLAKITIYLSTDEYALPYVPAKPFRPQVVFKLAVRSLVGSLRSVATATIWIVVYAVIWLPALLIFIFLRRWWQRRTREHSGSEAKRTPPG